MNRRDSLSALICASAGLVALDAAAQQPEAGRPLRIGLVPDFAPGWWASQLKVLTDVLAQAGKVEGRDFIYIRSGVFYGPETDRALERVLEGKPDLMVTCNLGYAAAARRRTTTIPIVMFISGFPVEGGVVESLARPGGNVTGMTIYASGEVFGKLVQLIHEARPGLRRAGVLMSYVPPFNPRPETDLIVGSMREVAARLGVELQVAEIAGPEQVDEALASFARQRVEALIVTGGTSLTPRRKDTLTWALEHRLPTIGDAPWSDAQGNPQQTLTYSANLNLLMRPTAEYVHRILWQGANPAVMPIQLPAKFAFTINQKSARAIGLTVPQSLLLWADRVVE